MAEETKTETPEAYVSPFIPDGYTISATIPAEPGRWSAVKINYRPLSADEESAIYARKAFAPLMPIARLYAEAFAGDGPENPPKLLGWDLKDREGKPLKVTAENIRQLSPQFFEVLKSYIDGSQLVEQEKNS